LDEGEAVVRHDMVDLLARDPNFPESKNVAFRRYVYYLDIKFKSMRMIDVDVPQPNGVMKKKKIWYLVYSVTNPGKVLPSVEAPDGSFQLQDSQKPVRFIPQLRLMSHESGKIYRDRVIPVAVAAIRMREDPNREFLNSAEIAREIPVGQTLWGVATWEDVDPEIDRFSILVTGLTNAYRWEDAPNAPQPGAAVGQGRKFLTKTLKLNFWRPGDEFYETEKEFRYGIPGQPNYEWIYR
jgi:hypothetical protein